MKKLIILLSILCNFFIIGCGDAGSLSQPESDTPADVAKAYFDALYNQNSLKKASSMATPSMARVMRSYGTAKQFSRNLINLQYDEVIIEIDRTTMSVREQFAGQAQINIIFTGYFNSKKIDDMRTVKLMEKNGKWYVNKILADPYAR